MKPFKFKKFEIQQSKDVFRVGTDGVLLGAFADVKNTNKVLEVGTGTGLISLMLAQRNLQAEFYGLDIQESAYVLTQENFRNSIFHNRLQALWGDYKSFETNDKFDLIVSNPPYFEESGSEKDKIARQTVELNFEQLISKSASLLSEEGILSVIIPAEIGDYFCKIANNNLLFLQRKIAIFGIENSKVKRLLLEFSLHENDIENLDFTIEKSPRQYSDQYLELTKEFHVFKS